MKESPLQSPKASVPARAARVVAVVLAVVALSGVSPAANADRLGTAKERAKVLRQRLDSLQAKAAAAVAQFETIHEDVEQAVGEAMEAEKLVVEAEADNAQVQDVADDRVRAIYKSGGRAALYAAVLRADDPHDAFARVENITAIVGMDAASADAAEASARRAQAALVKFEKATIVRQELEARAEAQTAEVERLMAAQEQMLASADAEVQSLIDEQRRREEAERQARVQEEAARLAEMTRVVSTGDLTNAYQPAAGTYACPAGAGVNFINSWHAPRSGGRMHQGTDVFAPYGSAAFAVTDGVVDKWGNGGLGGITLWIRAANGDRFYYAHNAQNLVPVGTAVRAGQVVALVGKTGNAAGTPPHIHFEAHPGGGAAANPYPFLAAICGQH